MSTLEQEILEKFDLLDDEAKARVRNVINQEIDPQSTTLIETLAHATKLRSQLRALPETPKYFNSLELIHEMREERDNAILDSLGFKHINRDSTE